MKTYDDVVGFDYTNTEEWRYFVKNQILPLHKYISKIVKLRENIEELLSNDLSDLIRNNTNIKQIFLGGVDENGDYKQNSLAKIYREFLGISTNLKEWVSLSKQQGIDAADYIKCEFSETEFLQFIKTLKEVTEKLFLLVEIDSQEISKNEVKELLENPEKIVDELKTIYDSLVSISANHSYYTFFAMNTKSIPRFYIEQAYPKLKDKFEEVSEFLGLEPKFFLGVKEGKIKRDYTMWGHKENGLAYLIYKLNGILWVYFEKEEFRKLFELITSNAEDLRQKYYENAKKSLDGIGWEFPDYVRTTRDTQEPYKYKIVGTMLTEYTLSVNTRGNHPWAVYGQSGLTKRSRWLTMSKKCNISLLKLIDDLSPALFISPRPKKTMIGNEFYYIDGIKIEFVENMLKLGGYLK